MKEIKRFKNANAVISISLGIFVIGFLIWFVVSICTGENFDTNCIVSASCLAGCVPLSLVYCLISLRRKRYLIKKYYGIVSEQDILLSKNLLEKTHCLRMNNYQFREDLSNNEESVTYNIKSLKTILYDLSRGCKVDEKLVRDYFDILEQVEMSPYKDNPSNAEFNEFIKVLCELLERNEIDF